MKELQEVGLCACVLLTLLYTSLVTLSEMFLESCNLVRREERRCVCDKERKTGEAYLRELCRNEKNGRSTVNRIKSDSDCILM